ncbi:hypothetical protein [Saccharopolyspora sp. NPDC002376]
MLGFSDQLQLPHSSNPHSPLDLGDLSNELGIGAGHRRTRLDDRANPSGRSRSRHRAKRGVGADISGRHQRCHAPSIPKIEHSFD